MHDYVSLLRKEFKDVSVFTAVVIDICIVLLLFTSSQRCYIVANADKQI